MLGAASSSVAKASSALSIGAAAAPLSESVWLCVILKCFPKRWAMPEKLVDVRQNSERLLHVFPVTIDNGDTRDENFEKQALERAAHAQLVPNEELEELGARIHTSHSGPLEPAGDTLGVLAETKEGLSQFVRDRAYFLWKEAGEPDGHADELWNRAKEEFLRRRAYFLWEREGRPDGRADEHWYRCQSYLGI